MNDEHNFFVINLGIKNGILEGDILSIYHGQSSIGDVKVTNARENNCVADISQMSGQFKDQIQIGDEAVKK